MKKTGRSRLITLLCLVLMCVILTSLFACSEEVSETDETSAFTGLPEYDVEKLDSYIKPFDYTGLDVTVGKNEKTPDKVWNTISDSAQIIAYPTLQVEYYAEQEKIKYKYYSAEYGIDYDELLDSLGVTEESIYEAAKSMVKDDLVLEYIVTDANITLSDAEKSEHLDKYAEKFVELYGYDKEYIKANMQDQLYSAMLYDKTVEFLILNNNVLKAE